MCCRKNAIPGIILTYAACIEFNHYNKVRNFSMESFYDVNILRVTRYFQFLINTILSFNQNILKIIT